MVNKTYSVILSVVIMLAFTLFPSVSSAQQSTTNLNVNVTLLGKVNALNLVEIGGNCKEIYAKVKVGKLTKPLGISLDQLKQLKIEVPYEIYWYPQVNLHQAKVKGELVADGKVEVNGENKELTIRYTPAKNPNGPAGVYALKLKLTINGKQVGHVIDAKVKINGDCGNPPGGDNPGDKPGDKPGDNPGDNPGDKPGDNPGGNPGDKPGDKPGDNPGNNPGDNPSGDKPSDNKAGGKMPKTATNYPIWVSVGLGMLLLGFGFLLYTLRNKMNGLHK